MNIDTVITLIMGGVIGVASCVICISIYIALKIYIFSRLSKLERTIYKLETEYSKLYTSLEYLHNRLNSQKLKSFNKK